MCIENFNIINNQLVFFATVFFEVRKYRYLKWCINCESVNSSLMPLN